jgi:hypothetical protein
MRDSKSLTFSAVESRIQAARLERSAALGEAIGNALSQLWFATRRVVATLAGKARELNVRTNDRQNLTGQHRVATPH